MALSGRVITNYWTSSDERTRGYVLNWTATQSVSQNQSTISWSLSTAGTYGSTVAERTLVVVLAGQTLVNKTDRVSRGAGGIASGSFTVNHASDGTYNFSGSIQAAVYGTAVNCTGSGSFSLDQIPRKASIINATSITDEGNPYFSFGNPGGFSMYAELEVNPNSTHLFKRDIPNTGSYTFALTEEERDVLRERLANANTGTLRYLLYSKNGSYVSYTDRQLTIADAQPTIEPSVKDVNPVTLAITKDENVFIRYHSNAEIALNAQAYKKASIKSVKASCGSQNINSDTGTISGVDSGVFAFSATDSRGNTVSQTKQVTFIKYVELTCDLVAKPPTTHGDLSFSVVGNYFNDSFGKTPNSLTVEYCYSENGSDFTDWEPIENVDISENRYSGSVTITGLDYKANYTVKARAKDLLAQATVEGESLVALPLFDWGKNGFNFNIPITSDGIEGSFVTPWKSCTLEATTNAITQNYVAKYRYSKDFLEIKINSGIYSVGSSAISDEEIIQIGDVEVDFPNNSYRAMSMCFDATSKTFVPVLLDSNGTISIGVGVNVGANHTLYLNSIHFIAFYEGGETNGL